MDRLTAQDLSMLWPDEVGWPQDIGALAVLDGGGLLDPVGCFRLGAARKAIEARLHLVPRFRQRLYMPRRGRGWPLWVDADAFDVRDHVQVFPLPAAADEAELLRAVERLRRRPMDRSRPLWEMWFLPGLPARRIGLFMRVHHAIADGVAGVATLGAFLDPDPEAPDAAPPPWMPAPPPSTRDLFGDNLQRRIHGLTRVSSAVARPITTARRVRAAWPAVHESFAEERAPRISLNRRIGPDRKLALVRNSLQTAKEIGHARQATVNDVLMTAVAGGLRDLLRSRGEPVEGVVLRGYVPVSLHREQLDQARGNLDGVMPVRLPIGVADPARRLRLIAAETAERKNRNRLPAGTLLRNGLIQRAFIHVMAHQRWANVYIANVPGPPVPLYFAKAPVLEVFPMVPLTGNLPLGVGALSYAGQFNITVVADRDACPDVEVFVRGTHDTLQSLATSRLIPQALGA
jgi:diacylglycerol O-acyltransferase